MSESCPFRECENCHAVLEHSSKACPSLQKCTKCRKRGHRQEQCSSKLQRSSADGFSCDLCHQRGHVEELCSRLWRTYDPDKIKDPIKMDTLLANCYQCGSAGHWGDDCKVIPTRRSVVNTNDVFSAKHANRYITDPTIPTGGMPSSAGPIHNIDDFNDEGLQALG